MTQTQLTPRTNHVQNARLTGERAAFQAHDSLYTRVIFADGESPLKHSHDISLDQVSFQWKYPLWYVNNVEVTNSIWNHDARAGVWYTNNLTITDSSIDAPKNFRRCNNLTLRNVELSDALETLWSCSDVTLDHVHVCGDYFAMNSTDMETTNLHLVGGFGKLCAQYQVTVISDEIHCDITRVGEQYTPFASVDETCRNISATCFAPTKAFNIAGLQTAAVMAADPLLRQRIWRGVNNDEVGEPNAFAVDATIAAFTQSGAWLDELREYIDHNFELAYEKIEQFNQTHPERAISICHAQATYLLWIDCSRISTHSDQLAQYILEAQGLDVSAGTQYRGNGNRFLRVNLATQSVRVAEGMEKLLQALASYPIA